MMAAIRTLRLAPEVTFTVAFLFLMVAVSAALGLPISYPTAGSASFVGIHYLYPLIGVGVWGAFAFLGQRRSLARVFLIALPCYALVLLAHFNFKLWLPHLNPRLYDAVYWQTDLELRAVVDACIQIRTLLDPIIPVNGHFYMMGFVALFYVSFCYHALWTPERFRQLFLAALLFQGLGSLAYLPFPALGPFIFEPGVGDAVAHAQQTMLKFYQDNVAHGPAWLAANGPAHLTAGLAAMPSLHSGGAFLFFLFAWKYGRVLVPLYALLLAYIMIAAVATRWHYVIDIPPGIALGWLSVWLAEKLAPLERWEEEAPPVTPEPDPVAS
jgi:hypothetical protein